MAGVKNGEAGASPALSRNCNLSDQEARSTASIGAAALAEGGECNLIYLFNKPSARKVFL
jgi:hypothetical protein